jgi:hypothetical protein
MKFSFIFFISIFFIGSTLTSCNEDVDLIGDFEETAVVHGLLDKSDSIHFIKINRAFIGPGNALEISQIPDSNEFQQVDATITEFVNGSQDRVWTLLDTLVENKDPNGVFYAPYQKMYYFKTTSTEPLNANAIYKLHISINGDDILIDGETEIVSGIGTSADGQTFRFDFVDDPGVYFEKGLSVSSGNSHIINATLEVKFFEYTAPGVGALKSFKWNLGESEVEPNGSKTFTMNGKTFYDLVLANITNNPSINQRKMYSIKVIATGGGEDLFNYMTVNAPSSTLAQSKPSFTNLSVNANHKVVGIFSSRYTHSIEKTYINPSNANLRMMATKSVEELCTGPITGNLFFCSQHIGDVLTSYYCP